MTEVSRKQVDARGLAEQALSPAEQRLAEDWAARAKSSPPAPKFRNRVAAGAKPTMYPDHPSESLWQALMGSAFGSTDQDFANMVGSQLVGTGWVPTPTDAEPTFNGMLAAMQGIGPRDEIEAMLAAQMVASHQAAMECFRRAMIPDQRSDIRQMNLNQANKLSRTHAALLEALNRHRGKGQQKVTVEHVHVEKGGQAIVGHVDRGGRDSG